MYIRTAQHPAVGPTRHSETELEHHKNSMTSATLAPATGRSYPHIPEALWPFVSPSSTWPRYQRLALLNRPPQAKPATLPRRKKHRQVNEPVRRNHRRAHCRN